MISKLAQKVWREGFAPFMSVKALEALKDGLITNDSKLIQNATTFPPPLQHLEDVECESACLIGYCGLKGEELSLVSEVEEFFGKMCYRCDQLLGEPAACRYLLNWWDESERGTAIADMIEEVDIELRKRYTNENSLLITKVDSL